MNPNPIRRASIARYSLADSVYESLLEAIVTRQLPSGAELNAVLLAEQLDVSRTPVVEAIRRLTADGLVRTSPGRKAHVARFTAKEIREIYELRTLLEGEAAHRAASRIDPEVVRDLRQRANDLASSREELNWCQQAIQFDIRFHDAVAASCGNSRLHADVARYRLLVRAFCQLTATENNLRDALKEHLEILAALEAGDSEAARQATVKHIETRLHSVLDVISE